MTTPTFLTPAQTVNAADIIRAVWDYSRVTWLDAEDCERSGHFHDFVSQDGDPSEWVIRVISRMGFVMEVPFLFALDRYAAGALAFRWM